MNQAAQELCLGNPGLLHKRKLLIDAARDKIIEQGFQFVKGKSRSKKCASSSDDTPAPKRRKSLQDIRDKRMKEIEDCQDLSDQISFKEKRIVCENVRDYKKCDELKEEVTALKKQRR